jgi:hypothetical protein
MSAFRGQDDGEHAVSRDATVTTRTTGSDGRSCQRCGGEIRGRRWNGFCSDRCRMAARRERIDERRRDLLGRLRATVSEVEAEWFPKGAPPFDE